MLLELWGTYDHTYLRESPEVNGIWDRHRMPLFFAANPRGFGKQGCLKFRRTVKKLGAD
jgi:hypothetical protein